MAVEMYKDVWKHRNSVAERELHKSGEPSQQGKSDINHDDIPEGTETNVSVKTSAEGEAGGASRGVEDELNLDGVYEVMPPKEQSQARCSNLSMRSRGSDMSALSSEKTISTYIPGSSLDGLQPGKIGQVLAQNIL